MSSLIVMTLKQKMMEWFPENGNALFMACSSLRLL